MSTTTPATVRSSSDDGDGGMDLRRPLVPAVGGKAEKLTVDDALQKYCGEFGWWQLRHFVLTSLAWALEGIHTMVMIFADRDPAWRCSSAACSEAATGSVCGLEPGSWEWDGGDGSSTVSEFGLICGQIYRVGLVQSLFFAGCMIGAGVFGHLSDSRMGRKGSLTIVCIMNAVFGCLTAFSPNYWFYVVLRLFSGFSTGGTGLCAFVLATEPVGPSKRGLVGMSSFYFFSGGIALVSGIAYKFQTWRALYVASSIPSILFVFLVLPFLHESPRWCLIRGRVGEAMKTMQSIARVNGRELPEDVVLGLDSEVGGGSGRGSSHFLIPTVVESKESLSGSLIDVLRCPLTRVRLFLAVIINFTCAIVYYGLSLNAVNLGTNLYLNVAVNAVAEMPAYFLTAIWLDRLGRKPLAIGTQWFSGLFCVAGSLMKAYGTSTVIPMICGVLGIFGMAGTYNLLFIYTVELFPTTVRNAALGCATQAAQLGAILAPFIVVCGGGIPFAVFGVCGIAGGLLGFYLPETLNKPLYDTLGGMEDGEGRAWVA
ncbi:PREDICTED: organic cation/carnitine transporter 4-like [Ipomoea nil]|uniref:organic cation/carnitine transporter 4-like n=1 Tax=Ipomoea nil TaxID=35883 RepID=UPI000900C439|nr:PREDICTED: organic cation/carnitine transporter 4-like [Ipomoea nil]